MGKTNAQKIRDRTSRLSGMKSSSRLAKQAMIKKKEGRVLSASEKHATKMQGETGLVLRAWEVLRTSADRAEAKLQELKAFGEESEEHTTARKAVEIASGEKEEAVANLLKIILPNVGSYAKTPKMSRVMQSCIKMGTNDQRMEVLNAFSKLDAITALTDGAAHHIFLALIRHSPLAVFKKLMELVTSNMAHAVSNRFGLAVVNALHSNKFATTTEKQLMCLGVFKDSTAVMKAWKGFPDLDAILAVDDTPYKRRLLGGLFKHIDRWTSAGTSKEAYNVPFVQHLISIYFRRGLKHDITELSMSLRDKLATLLLTREGALLADQIFSVLPPRNRKELLHIVAQDMPNLAQSKFAAPFVARVCDLNHDHQITSKYLAGPMSKALNEILESPYGHCILLHLLTPNGERKFRAIPPSWKEYNLYSRDNQEWNHVTWLDADYSAETVEVCAHPGEQNHLLVLKGVLPALLSLMSGVELPKKASDVDASARVKLHHISKIAKEIVYLCEEDPTFSRALEISKTALEQVKQLRPRKTTRDDEETPATAEIKEAAPTTKRRKLDATAAAAPRTSAASAAGGRKSTKKADAEPKGTEETPLKKRRSQAKAAEAAAETTPKPPRRSSVTAAATATATPANPQAPPNTPKSALKTPGATTAEKGRRSVRLSLGNEAGEQASAARKRAFNSL